MANLADHSDHEVEMKQELAFRRGYLHGAEAIVASVAERLSKANHEKLSRWLAAELRPWAAARLDCDPAPPIAPEL